MHSCLVTDLVLCRCCYQPVENQQSNFQWMSSSEWDSNSRQANVSKVALLAASHSGWLHEPVQSQIQRVHRVRQSGWL